MSTATGTEFPAPYPSRETEPYWAAARAGQLLLQRCEDCRQCFLYPRMVCPGCWGERLTWTAALGHGVVETATVVHRAAHPSFQTVVPYTCAVVRLDEGPKFMTNLVGRHGGRAAIGRRVRITFTTRGDWSLPVAELIEDKPATHTGGTP